MMEKLQSKKKLIAYLATLLIAGVIYGLSGQYELLGHGIFSPHDSFYPVTPAIFDGYFSLFNPQANFSKNFIAFYVHIPDRFFLKLLLETGITFGGAQLIHTITCYFLLVSLSFYSYSKLISSPILLVLITLAYCFSPFMSIFYNSGIFYVISTVIAISLIPIYLYALLDLKNKENIWVIFCSMFIFASNLMFIWPALILLLSSAAFQWRLLDLEWIKGLPPKVLALSLFSCIPIGCFLWLNISFPDARNFMNGSAASDIEGSLFYPLMQISSWAIYNDWQPRAILTFADFFFSPGYKFLSVVLIIVAIAYLVESKRLLIVLLLFVAAFGAKGPNFPLGEIYSFILNKVPFGYMIRTPDNKFGAFIPALICIGIAVLPKINRTVAASILGLFLCLNIYGIYFNGAMSAEKGGHAASSYLYDDTSEYLKVADIINGQKSAVVISPFETCSGVYTQNKFHTCNDLVLSQSKRQVVSKDFGSIDKLTETYKPFATVMYFNKNKVHYAQQMHLFEGLEIFPEYKVIYDSRNYRIFSRNSAFESCNQFAPYACIKNQGHYLYSLQGIYFEYLTGANKYTIANGLVQTNEPLKSDPTKVKLILEWLYMSSWLINLILLRRHLNLGPSAQP